MYDYEADDMVDSLANIFGDYMEAAHCHDKGHKVKQVTRVYRVELADGMGPFNSNSVGDHEMHERVYDKLEKWHCCDPAADAGEQMGITEEAFKEAHGHAAYGCPSLEALKTWFCPESRKYLETKYKAKLVVYDIPVGGYIMHVSDVEVVFSRPDSTRIGEFDLITLEVIG